MVTFVVRFGDPLNVASFNKTSETEESDPIKVTNVPTSIEVTKGNIVIHINAGINFLDYQPATNSCICW
jgi:hypothetical protein